MESFDKSAGNNNLTPGTTKFVPKTTQTTKIFAWYYIEDSQSV
jgi:hypothetical protein